MFKCHGLGELYKRYVSRLQNSYFNAYLLLEIAVSLVYMGTILIVNRVSQADSAFIFCFIFPIWDFEFMALEKH